MITFFQRWQLGTELEFAVVDLENLLSKTPFVLYFPIHSYVDMRDVPRIRKKGLFLITKENIIEEIQDKIQCLNSPNRQSVQSS